MTDYQPVITEFLKNKGASLPVELSKHMDMETYLLNAILSDLVRTGAIKSTFYKIGSSSLYYLSGQEESARARLMINLSIPELKALERMKNARVILESEVTPQERFLIRTSLRDFVFPKEIDGKVWLRHYSASDYEITRMQAPDMPMLDVKSKTEKKVPAKIEKAKISVDEFDKKVHSYLIDCGEVFDKVTAKKGKEFDYLLAVDSKMGKQVYFVKAKLKASINESDLSLAYHEGLQKKKPVIFLTNGNLTRKAKKFKEANAGDLLKFIQIK